MGSSYGISLAILIVDCNQRDPPVKALAATTWWFLKIGIPETTLFSVLIERNQPFLGVQLLKCHCFIGWWLLSVGMFIPFAMMVEIPGESVHGVN